MNRWSLIALCIALGVAVVGYAGARSNRDEGTGDTELLFGDYRCGSDFQTAFLSLVFQSTNGILDDYQFLGGSIPLASSPGETCDPLTAGMADLLRRRSCAVSAIETQQGDSGEDRSFRFVCDGPRNRVVQTMAAAARQVLTPETP